MTIEGNLDTAGSGHRVAIQLRGLNNAWQTVRTGKTDSGGGFKLTWRSKKSGRFLARAVEHGVQKSDATTAPSTVITVYKRSQATWYDQSGTTSACGVKLRKKTLGVANKTLPCGTLIDFSFRGRSITVPVIDRGPYNGSVSYDFTIEVARRLGFVNTGRGTVGALRHTNKFSVLDGPLVPGAGS